VLLAEDNVVNQRICGAMLERCGFQVSCVSNGEEAVEAAATGDYALILMDCHMPRMDGLRATRAIRLAEGAAAQTLVIGLLSSERAALEDACRRAGMNEILSKPLTMAKIETLCERHFPLVTP
jgi:CheY-like chemotaxis protein